MLVRRVRGIFGIAFDGDIVKVLEEILIVMLYCVFIHVLARNEIILKLSIILKIK